MRRSRPIWPTHKAKRHMPTRPQDVRETRQLSTGEMAQSLVARGLASPLILDNYRPPRPRWEQRR